MDPIPLVLVLAGDPRAGGAGGNHEPWGRRYQRMELLGLGGVHFGLYSAALALRVGHEGQVAAFEPNPVSFARLERHRRMNGLDRLKTY